MHQKFAYMINLCSYLRLYNFLYQIMSLYRL
nr:MAG TPA: hypothetical protein [Caudoviricetes sp.]